MAKWIGAVDLENYEAPSQEVPGSNPGAGSSREVFHLGEKSCGFSLPRLFTKIRASTQRENLVALGCVVSL